MGLDILSVVLVLAYLGGVLWCGTAEMHPPIYRSFMHWRRRRQRGIGPILPWRSIRLVVLTVVLLATLGWVDGVFPWSVLVVVPAFVVATLVENVKVEFCRRQGTLK